MNIFEYVVIFCRCLRSNPQYAVDKRLINSLTTMKKHQPTKSERGRVDEFYNLIREILISFARIDEGLLLLFFDTTKRSRRTKQRMFIK